MPSKGRTGINVLCQNWKTLGNPSSVYSTVFLFYPILVVWKLWNKWIRIHTGFSLLNLGVFLSNIWGHLTIPHSKSTLIWEVLWSHGHYKLDPTNTVPFPLEMAGHQPVFWQNVSWKLPNYESDAKNLRDKNSIQPFISEYFFYKKIILWSFKVTEIQTSKLSIIKYFYLGVEPKIGG